MYSPNHYVVEAEEERLGFHGGPKSFLSTEPNSLSPLHHHPTPEPANNLNRVLYNDLVEIVPLIQSLINDTKNRNAVKSMLGKKHSVKEQLKRSKNDKNGSADDYSVSAANMAAEKDREELNALREQLEDLCRKILEKDELLKPAETSKNQMVFVQSQVDELKRYGAEKDALIKSSQQQLNDAKIKLADKQGALEKLQWEANTSNQKVERLQEQLDSMQSQISSLMIIFKGLSKDDSATLAKDYDVSG